MLSSGRYNKNTFSGAVIMSVGFVGYEQFQLLICEGIEWFGVLREFDVYAMICLLKGDVSIHF